MNKGKTVFAQIMSIFNEYEFKKCIDRDKGNQHAIKSNCSDQFMEMSFAQFTERFSLRDNKATLNLCGDLYRPGIKHLHIKTVYGTYMNTVYTQIWIAICDYLPLIIAKKRNSLATILHSISNSIGQILFNRADIRDLHNQPTVPLIVPEAGSVVQLSFW